MHACATLQNCLLLGLRKVMAFTWLWLHRNPIFAGSSSFKEQTSQQFGCIRNWRFSQPASSSLSVLLLKRRKSLTPFTPCYQSWKQSIAVKFAFDFSTFVSSSLFVSGVAAIGAVGLHRSRDDLVFSKEKLSSSSPTALEEEHELPRISDYRFDDPGSARSIGKRSQL
ncbi:hypothetical protein GpartN1_g7758.t1 [Galdieria partita]|uniref:Uncharacterized protein n=1 Tax=Galdieria partita TaxID=83374 RepID=A0A9C7UV93_9RHOD|nr:hypothetical protein GpartN1_g7758.t1 [Galdieria partita]